MAKEQTKYAKWLWGILGQGAVGLLDKKESDNDIILNFSPNNIRRIVIGLDGALVQFYTTSGSVKKRLEVRKVNIIPETYEQLTLPESVDNYYGVLDLLRRPRVFSSIEEIIILGVNKTTGASFLNSGVSYFFNNTEETVESQFKRLGCVTLIKTPMDLSDFVEFTDKSIYSDPLRLLTPTLKGLDLSVKRYNGDTYFLNTFLRPRYYALDVDGGALSNYFEKVKLEYRDRKIAYHDEKPVEVSLGVLEQTYIAFREMLKYYWGISRGRLEPAMRKVYVDYKGHEYIGTNFVIDYGRLGSDELNFYSCCHLIEITTSLIPIEERGNAEVILRNSGVSFKGGLKPVDFSVETVASVDRLLRVWIPFLNNILKSMSLSVEEVVIDDTWLQDYISLGYVGNYKVQGSERSEVTLESLSSELNDLKRVANLNMDLGGIGLFVESNGLVGCPAETVHEYYQIINFLGDDWESDLESLKSKIKEKRLQLYHTYMGDIDLILTSNTRDSMYELVDLLGDVKDYIKNLNVFELLDSEMVRENIESILYGVSVNIRPAIILFSKKVKRRYKPVGQLRIKNNLDFILSDDGTDDIFAVLRELLIKPSPATQRKDLSKVWENAVKAVEEGGNQSE